MKWFGEPWPSAGLRAPVCVDDADRVPVPVGASCLYCTEPIEADDRGELMGYVDFDAQGEPYSVSRPAHLECVFREMVGGPAHVQGRCTCHGGTEEPDLGMSAREAARWVWDHYSDARTFHRYDHPPEEGRVRP